MFDVLTIKVTFNIMTSYNGFHFHFLKIDNKFRI